MTKQANQTPIVGHEQTDCEPQKVRTYGHTLCLRLDYSDEEYERLLEAQEWPLAEADKISELLLEECSAYGWYEVIAFDADLSDAAAVHDWVHDSGSVVVDRLPDDDETLVVDGHCYQIRSELYAVANELIQIRTKLIECLGGHAVQN